MYEYDSRHVDVLMKDFGLEQGNSVQTPATHDVTEGEPEPLHQVQHSKYKLQDVCTLVKIEKNKQTTRTRKAKEGKPDATEPYQVEEA